MGSSIIGFYTLLKREFLRFFKVPNNTIFPQLITVTFYMIIFGIAIGTRIKEVNGVPYLLFILPGLYLQNVINGSYSNPSGSLYVSRQWGNIEDVLVAPISHSQMVFSYILGGMARGFFLGLGTILIALIFLRFSIFSLPIFILYSLLVSFMFACCGVIVGLWSKTWEQLNIFINFVVTPLTFLGGVFYTLDMVPRSVAIITQLNPVFYLINGTRYGMLGISDGSIFAGFIFVIAASVILYFIVYLLFKKGYNLKV